MYALTIEAQDTGERFEIDAKQIAMFALPPAYEAPPPGVYEILLIDDPIPGRKYWSYNLDPARIGN